MSVIRVLAGERDFRWRGAAVSRIEGLSDAVFALALTLIVASLSPPRTWEELQATFLQMPAVAIGFVFLSWFWLLHFRFHRRFGLEDLTTTWLNLGLLFLILLYVYPLRFLIGFLYDVLVLGRGWTTTDSSGADAPLFRSAAEIRKLMLIYSSGFTAIFLMFSALYARAWKFRLELELDSVERVRTKSAMHSHFLTAGVGLTSIVLASWNERWVPLSGWLYCSLGPLHFAHGWLTGRAVERYRGKVPGAPMPS